MAPDTTTQNSERKPTNTDVSVYAPATTAISMVDQPPTTGNSPPDQSRGDWFSEVEREGFTGQTYLSADIETKFTCVKPAAILFDRTSNSCLIVNYRPGARPADSEVYAIDGALVDKGDGKIPVISVKDTQFAVHTVQLDGQKEPRLRYDDPEEAQGLLILLAELKEIKGSVA
jgi:hypothetical protein